MRGYGKRVEGSVRRLEFHVLYYQTSETGWVPETKLKDFKLNLKVPHPAPTFCVWFVLRIAPHTVGHPSLSQSQPSTVSRSRAAPTSTLV